MRALIDLSSVIWTCLMYGKDIEFGKKVIKGEKEYLVNSANHGFEGALKHLQFVMEDLSLVPMDMIFVMEGKNSKAQRLAIHENYKTGRDKLEEQYVEFNLCKEQLLQFFLNMGAQVCWQDGGVEADDVLGYLAKNLEGEIWIISGDKDLAQAVDGERVNHWRAGARNENPFGPFPHQWIPVWIALVGDSNDKIPGAKGFGAGAGQKLLEAFGDDGLELMEGLIKRKELRKLEEDLASCKELQKVIDDAPGVYMSYELGRLRIDKVNTLRQPLQWRVGMVKTRPKDVEQFWRPFCQFKKIITQENYDEAVEWSKKHLAQSPYYSLDVETATPDESDQWLRSRGKEDRVDVFGSNLTSLQLSFGRNLQATLYFAIDNIEEEGRTNLSINQVRQFLEFLDSSKITVIQNVSFELPVCYMAWGEVWKDDPVYHGFLRNVRDTKIMSSYVDENFPAGLKDNSKRLIGYDQITYEQVTQKDLLKGEWNGVGRIVQEYLNPVIESTGEIGEDGIEVMVHVRDDERIVISRKMNQMTAREVFDYGCDDTICTAALANHFKTVMEIEKTWHVFEEVETFPAYLTALAYVQGTAFSLEAMAKQEKEDNAAFEESKKVLDTYLIGVGFEGTRFLPIEELDASACKRAYLEIYGKDLMNEEGIKVTTVRTPSKLAKLIEIHEPESVLPALIQAEDIDSINDLLQKNFKGEPQLDLASPKQMKGLLYDQMKIPVKVINDTTIKERQEKPELAAAVSKFKKIRSGSSHDKMTEFEKELLKKKAKTDDTAVAFALAFDKEILDDDSVKALEAIQVMKKVMTRKSLYYGNYWKGLHWKDGKLHSSLNQCAAVTRRYSASDQNLQQLPKKGEGIKFRECFVPHKKDAVIESIDFSGQELRLSAEKSQDKNLLSCYVGDNLKDVHSITAAGAMENRWGKKFVQDLLAQCNLYNDDTGKYEAFRYIYKKTDDAELKKKAEDHRKSSKNVNFAAQNGAQAVKISETEIMPLEEAQLFLDAREAMFPGVRKAAERAAQLASETGRAYTFMGAIRHLRAGVMSDDRGESDRAARQAWNFEIQGSAGEMSKLAMGRLWTSGIYFRYDARFIAPIHDELVSSVAKEDVIEFTKEKNAAMTAQYADMKVPILASISIGPNFGVQIECGDEFDPLAIQAALDKIKENQNV